ncbi:MAG: methyltransferase domain-containing protein [Rhodobacteraceae bacterium]|nr:methyltransferase domain-containing protein [Paracoccaceae bacterium]MCF8512844.1 methyltransferase domain-containing protein [Paracoccaceae bacterium]MCF8517089.1 methyltransferase domain-containing protein [Paracoccaceae bacterium]
MKTAAEKETARSAAVELLLAVLDEGAMLAQIPPSEGLSGPDRARAERLAADVLRHLDQIDRILKPLMRKAPPLPVLNVLRLAVLERAQGAAAYGVVNEAVGLVRANRRTQHLAGLVNAVLRALPDPVSLADLPVPMLPRWLRQPLVHAWGRDVVAAIEAVHVKTPPVDLTRKASASASDLPEGSLLPNGSIRLAQGGQITALPGYAAGAWWVQDAAASMAVQLLAPMAGEAVLDLCAAPGGKTMQIADTGADVTAVDISEPRLARVRENLARTGLKATVVAADALHWQPEGLFDAILLDAPCSASGTIRRHPDLPFVKDGSEVEALAALQSALLDRALMWLKPGGRLVFVTCSLLPAEGEEQLANVLARNPGLVVDKPTEPWIDPAWVNALGGLRLRPDYWAEAGGMDGFFMAKLRRA